MTKIKILDDFQYEELEHLGEAIAPGTVIEDAELWSSGDALYSHPVTGSDWVSYEGSYEILED